MGIPSARFERGQDFPGEALDFRLALGPAGHHELKRDVPDPHARGFLQSLGDPRGVPSQVVFFLPFYVAFCHLRPFFVPETSALC